MQPLNTAQCVLLGAAGAAVVAAATYPIGSTTSGYVWLLVEASVLERLGFALRLIVFAGFGAFWGYIHRPEHDLKRAFQIGVAAPAALMGMIYANDVGGAATEQAGRPVLVAAAGDTFPLRAGPSDQRSVVDQLIKGLLGK